VARLGCRGSCAQSAGRRSGGVASDDATPQLHRAGGQSILERRQSLFVCSPERSQVEGYGRGRAPSTRPWWGPPRLGGGSRARRTDVLRSGFASLRKPHAGGAPAPPPPSQERHSHDDITKSAAAASAFRPRRRDPESPACRGRLEHSGPGKSRDRLHPGQRVAQIARSFSAAGRRSFTSWRGSGPGSWTIDSSRSYGLFTRTGSRSDSPASGATTVGGSARTGTRTGSSTGTVSWLGGSRSTICRPTRRIASIGGLSAAVRTVIPVSLIWVCRIKPLRR
jgi:hypothetical protein